MKKSYTLAACAVLLSVTAPGQSPTRFKLEMDANRWWLASPTGSKFVSLGVCCADTGTSFAAYDPANPSYAGYLYYKDRAAWATDVVKRLTSWNFNTAGAWSDSASLSAVNSSTLYQTPILNLGATAGVPWKDLWSPETEKSFDDSAKNQIKSGAEDKTTIGYFSDNELGWWEGALFDWIWKSDPNSGQRTHFLAVLKQSYGSWTYMLHDFVPVNASDFGDLLGQGRLYLKPGGGGMRVVQAYISVVADRYYSLAKDAIKKYDPAALYLGDRYISNFYPEVAKAAGKYVDIVSTNLNGDWSDGSFARFYLQNLEADCGKPILVSEYYQTATENNSGNKNSSSGFPVASTQAERASLTEVATKFLLAQPYVVGAHWFQYYDEPKNGRGDGENYDFGLVDTSNTPYPALTQVFSSLNPTALHANGSPTPVDASSGIPQAPNHMEKLDLWPRNRSYIPPTSDSGRADLYACYGSDGIYVAIYWNEDRFAEAFYTNGVVPPADYPQIHLRVGRSYTTLSVPPTGPIQVGGQATVIQDLRGVRNEVMIKIPYTTLGSTQLTSGQQFMFDIGLATRGRAYFGRWRGSYSLGAS